MAKAAYSKINKKANADVSVISYEDLDIEVRRYLPINEKLEIIGNVVERSLDDEAHYFNDLKVDMFLWLQILYKYTNLSFTDKQKEDETKIFDNCWSNGLFALIYNEIPFEIDDLRTYCARILKSVYTYRNSAMGILQAMSEDYSNLDYDVTNMIDSIKDPEAIKLLRQVSPMLGLS